MNRRNAALRSMASGRDILIGSTGPAIATGLPIAMLAGDRSTALQPSDLSSVLPKARCTAR
jgi:hypothetical protein